MPAFPTRPDTAAGPEIFPSDTVTGYCAVDGQFPVLVVTFTLQEPSYEFRQPHALSLRLRSMPSIEFLTSASLRHRVSNNSVLLVACRSRFR
jgi:hypothetical protein